MSPFMKISGCILSVFILANGLWVFFMPPPGDAPVAVAIIGIGLVIPVLMFYVSRTEER